MHANRAMRDHITDESSRLYSSRSSRRHELPPSSPTPYLCVFFCVRLCVYFGHCLIRLSRGTRETHTRTRNTVAASTPRDKCFVCIARVPNLICAVKWHWQRDRVCARLFGVARTAVVCLAYRRRRPPLVLGR